MRSLLPYALLMAGLATVVLTSCKQEAPREQAPKVSLKPKYKLPNQLTMSDGCIVRVQSSMMKDGGVIYYYTMITVNSWSKTCSEGKERYREDEIVKAKYL